MRLNDLSSNPLVKDPTLNQALAKCTIICFSSIDWDHHHQRPQAMMTALAAQGVDVIYVDNLGLRMPRLRDTKRILRRLSSVLRQHRTGLAKDQIPVRRVSPLVLPLHHVAPIKQLTGWTLAQRLRKMVPVGNKTVVWSYLPLPVIRTISERVDADAFIYDWADDFSERVLSRSSRHLRRISGWQKSTIDAADLVFATSQALVDKRGMDADKTYVIPHGIHRLDEIDLTEPEALKGIPRPIIGFVGSISEWTDVDLILKVAARRPEWSLVLVGPSHISTKALSEPPNVHYLGRCDHRDVHRHIEAFDAALIPYKDGPAMEGASPVKLREYLAHGLPVVSVAIPDVRRFAPPVRLAATPEEFELQLEAALAEGRHAPSPLHRRSWDDAAAEASEHLESFLRRRST